MPDAASASAGSDAGCGMLGNARICCGRSGEIPNVNCLSPEDAKAPPCTEEDGLIEGKTISLGGACCEGLVRIEFLAPADGGSCTTAGTQSTLLCAHCGDGKCVGRENRCSCPADCSN